MFQVCSFYACKNSDGYSVFKLLKQLSENTFYVRSYWPVNFEPSFNDFEKLDLQSACSLLEYTQFKEYTLLGFEEISDVDLREIAQFERIMASKANRLSEFENLLASAEKKIEEENYLEAIALLTEAAPYSKFDLRAYALRGFAYMKLEKRFEAVQDFDFVLMNNPNHKEVKIWRNLLGFKLRG